MTDTTMANDLELIRKLSRQALRLLDYSVDTGEAKVITPQEEEDKAMTVIELESWLVAATPTRSERMAAVRESIKGAALDQVRDLIADWRTMRYALGSARDGGPDARAILANLRCKE